MFTEPYIGSITIFGGDYTPAGWMACNGQLLSIATYTALFALIGTTYGGDGQSTFALPDMRGRVAAHTGQGDGLSKYSLGNKAGSESIALSSAQLPPHTHPYISLTVHQTVNTGNGTVDSPQNAYPAAGASVYTNSGDNTSMGVYTSVGGTVATGNGLPLPIVQPYLAMNYIIAAEGIFPSRN